MTPRQKQELREAWKFSPEFSATSDIYTRSASSVDMMMRLYGGSTVIYHYGAEAESVIHNAKDI